jgi:hypothetical protein
LNSHRHRSFAAYEQRGAGSRRPETPNTNPKSETRNPKEIRNPNFRLRYSTFLWIDTLAEMRNYHRMKALILLVCWCILFVLCWPVALLVLVLLPIVWLLLLPFRIAFVVIDAAFALIQALLFLPARLLGWRRCERRATR